MTVANADVEKSQITECETQSTEPVMKDNFLTQQWQRFRLFYITHVSPQTVNEDGVSRLVSIDFIRGIAIFVTLICHIVTCVTSPSLIDGTIDLSPFHKVIVIIVVAVTVVFGPMRSLFIYVSGFAFGITYVRKLFNLSVQ